MPLPKRRSGEKKSDFVKRCMSNDVMKREYKKTTQRLTVCSDLADKKIAASTVPGDIFITAEAVIDVKAAEGKLRTLSIRAYSGGTMVLMGWPLPVVIDMLGLEISNPPPILRDHDQSQVVGHSTKVTAGTSKLDIKGEISGTGEAAQEVVTNADNGFPWQASVGLRTEQVVMVEEGEVAKVNGRNWKGPIYVARKATLKEVSIVAVGADDDTKVRIAATANNPVKEVLTMTFEQWLTGKGLELAKLDETKVAELKAEFEAEQASSGGEGEQTPAAGAGEGEGKGSEGSGEGEGDAPAGGEVKASHQPNVPADVAKLRKDRAAEHERIAAVEKICATEQPDILAKAIREGWSVDKTELAVLRASRPGTLAIHTSQDKIDENSLVAIGCVNGGFDSRTLEASFSEQVCDVADKHRGLGLQDFFRLIAASEGITLPRNVGTGGEFIRAAFSTVSLPGILGAVANKMLLDGYNYVENTWRLIANIASVKNFQLHTRYRMTDNFKFLKVGPDGELKHGQVGQQTYTNQADTYGILFSLTRQAIINDELRAFASVPQHIGMGAGEAIADALWTLWIDNATSSFFTTARGNLDEGADTALAISSLTLAEILFLTQTKPNGTPIGATPKILLVPPALKVAAEQLMKSVELNEASASGSPTGKTNPHAGKFDVACSTYLQNANYTGYSSTAWYLVADPRRLAAMEIAFLNGIDEPTVEQAQADFNTLGVQFRGFVDFGVALQDYRGAVKMSGVTSG